jgi:hypothetical protein
MVDAKKKWIAGRPGKTKGLDRFYGAHINFLMKTVIFRQSLLLDERRTSPVLSHNFTAGNQAVGEAAPGVATVCSSGNEK